MSKAKKRPLSSTRWLERQKRDVYVKAAKAQGYRSRAAFKLVSLAEKYRLFRPGQRVVDLGAAPGGWLQVAVEAIGPKGRAVGVDLAAIAPLAGATLIRADVAEPGLAARLRAELGGAADLVLSDMASATTGDASIDHLRTLALAEAAFELAQEILARGAAFVVKLRQGEGEPAFFKQVQARFAEVVRAKPPASRAESAELYFVARGLKTA